MSAVELSEIVRNYAIVIGGGMGIALAVWRGVAADRQSRASRDQANITRREHITELFIRAVDQLGAEKFEVRFGSVLTLTGIGSDFPDFSQPVFELLSGYVRERTQDAKVEEPPPDILYIMKFMVKHSGKSQMSEVSDVQ